MTTQFPNIPYSPLQGMLNAIDNMENQLADAQDKLLSKLMKPKSRVEYAVSKGYVIDITTDSGREIQVYYLVDDLPLSNQTDITDDSYILEQVTYKGRKVHYSGKGEQVILEYLNRLNPAGLKYSVRA